MVARRYAKALLEVMAKENLIGPVRTDMYNIKDLTKEKNACDYLSDKMVTRRDKIEAFLSCNPLTRSFLNMVMDYKQEKELYEISKEYIDMLNEQIGEADVEVSSSVALLPREKTMLKEKLERRLGKKANLFFRIDKKLIGGLSVHYGDKVIDGSINGMLADMLRKMSEE